MAEKEFADKMNLRFLRKERQLLQKEVAVGLGISRAAYSNYETGARTPDLSMLQRMADFFVVSLDELVHYVPKNTRQQSLQPEEKSLLNKYRKLSVSSKKRVQHQLDFELELQDTHEAGSILS